MGTLVQLFYVAGNHLSATLARTHPLSRAELPLGFDPTSDRARTGRRSTWRDNPPAAQTQDKTCPQLFPAVSPFQLLQVCTDQQRHELRDQAGVLSAQKEGKARGSRNLNSSRSPSKPAVPRTPAHACVPPLPLRERCAIHPWDRYALRRAMSSRALPAGGRALPVGSRSPAGRQLPWACRLDADPGRVSCPRGFTFLFGDGGFSSSCPLCALGSLVRAAAPDGWPAGTWGETVWSPTSLLCQGKSPHKRPWARCAPARDRRGHWEGNPGTESRAPGSPPVLARLLLFHPPPPPVPSAVPATQVPLGTCVRMNE
ncbi:uncharacterized protein LOC142861880 [Microcebus murinus]|uniref:uncharacterized protein LOC142861880 n=1 Tax=Microcebus murinus TaxID=30608 RepID=UPI003F6A6DA8